MCHAILEITYKKTPEDKIHEYPVKERDYIERVNELRADELVKSVVIFERKCKITQTNTWVESP